MSPAPPNSNKSLPFDVLGIIFSHYASEETIHYPLETLLLVCRSWSEAALGHHALWGHINVYLGHNPTARFWQARLPQRLARTGSTTPLYIDIRNYLSTPYRRGMFKEVDHDELYHPLSCGLRLDNDEADDEEEVEYEECLCHEVVRACILSSLQLLAGENGELCSRWRHVRLDLGHAEGGFQGDVDLAKTLSYPTPSLTRLVLNNVQFYESVVSPPLFPKTPFLDDITIVDCELPSFPTFDYIKHAEIGWKENEEFQELVGFRNATSLRTLTLHVPFFAGIPIPAQLPHLHSLKISGNNFSADFYHCDMPNLTTLSLDFQYENLLAHLLKCKGFYPERLRTISLSWDVPLLPTVPELLVLISSLLGLFVRATKVECVIASGDILSVLMKVLWQAEYRRRGGGKSVPPQNEVTEPLIRNAYIINQEKGDRYYVRGNETMEDLERIAESWNLIPMAVTIEEYLRTLQVHATVSAVFAC